MKPIRFGLRGIIYAVVVLVAIGTFAAARVWTNQSDLWLNLFAEAVGVAFTVLIIERLIRYEDSRRTKPARYAAFMDALLIYNRFVGLWFDIVRTTLDPERHRGILAIEDISLLDVRFGEVVALLNLEADAPVIPKRNWRTHLRQSVEDIDRLIDRCLQRYSTFMEPALIRTLLELERTSFMSLGKLTQALVQADRELGVKRGPYFGWGGPATSIELIAPLKGLGHLLSQLRPQFAEMPDVPKKLDMKQTSQIEALRKRVSDAMAGGKGAPSDGSVVGVDDAKGS